MTETDNDRARIVGINHVALGVGDIDAALEFYGSLFEFDLRGRTDDMAFIDIGDQFINLSVSEADDRDERRHFGLVVDDPATVERRLDSLGIDRLPTRFFDFLDPWGNRVQVVGYAEVQFTKADHVLEGMEIDAPEKSDDALAELAEKGLPPE